MKKITRYKVKATFELLIVSIEVLSVLVIAYSLFATIWSFNPTNIELFNLQIFLSGLCTLTISMGIFILLRRD
jgi:hypothetical protein